ncbi:type I methionyl aminopeptidase [Candidatus Parcubacteria bacterium]|nr:MAG: type I methionyl aminopeptidase [Candidatus Parcubacteria bacterium]
MALIKTSREIEMMRQGGTLLARALQAAVDAVRPGVRLPELDDIARQIIEKDGGKPSFLGYTGGGKIPFPSTLCISVNNEVVHGPANRDIILQDGDIVGLDIGCWYQGLATDMAATVPVGNVSKERLALLRVTRQAMYAGVEAAVAGNVISDIGAAVEDSVNTKKYGIVRSLVGHGVGHAVHENPQIPNYRSADFPIIKIKPGMCLAIEPMITTGDWAVETNDDGWTIVTRDGSDAAHFEVTVVVGEDGPEIITPQPKIKI